MTQMLVGVDDLPELDGVERERRSSASQKMQEKLTHLSDEEIAEDFDHLDLLQGRDGKCHAFAGSFPRELGGDNMADVTWLDEKGESPGEHLTQTPVDGRVDGRAITASSPLSG